MFCLSSCLWHQISLYFITKSDGTWTSIYKIDYWFCASPILRRNHRRNNSDNWRNFSETPTQTWFFKSELFLALFLAIKQISIQQKIPGFVNDCVILPVEIFAFGWIASIKKEKFDNSFGLSTFWSKNRTAMLNWRISLIKFRDFGWTTLSKLAETGPLASGCDF